jgi:hypothetical protein
MDGCYHLHFPWGPLGGRSVSFAPLPPRASRVNVRALGGTNDKILKNNDLLRVVFVRHWQWKARIIGGRSGLVGPKRRPRDPENNRAVFP